MDDQIIVLEYRKEQAEREYEKYLCELVSTVLCLGFIAVMTTLIFVLYFLKDGNSKGF